MTKYRDVYLEREKTLADTGTYTIELAVVDPISVIEVVFSATNSETGNKKNPIARNVRKIEVIDGAKVIYALDGRLAKALALAMSNKFPYYVIDETANAKQVDSFPLYFGRWLNDNEYALVPQKFKNLQLRVTWDLNTVRPAGEHGFKPGTCKLSVMCRLIEEPAEEPKGHFMPKVHYSFTSSASGEERIPLPTDYPYAIMLIKAFEEDVNMNSIITNVKFSIDADKDIPFDHSLRQQLQFIESKYGKTTINQRILFDNEERKQTWVAESENVLFTPESTFGYYSITDVRNSGFKMLAVDREDTAITNGTGYIRTTGLAPYNIVPFYFGNFDDHATYLQAQNVGDIKVILTQNHAGGEVDVAIAQLKPY
jgi:hypothetical protein